MKKKGAMLVDDDYQSISPTKISGKGFSQSADPEAVIIQLKDSLANVMNALDEQEANYK